MNELEHFGSKNSQVEGREMQSKSHERIATERCQGTHSRHSHNKHDEKNKRGKSGLKAIKELRCKDVKETILPR